MASRELLSATTTRRTGGRGTAASTRGSDPSSFQAGIRTSTVGSLAVGAPGAAAAAVDHHRRAAGRRHGAQQLGELLGGGAVGLAAGIIVAGWVVYDLLCKSPLRNNERLFAAVLLLLVGVLAWGLCELFSGRGAYIHFGAVLGTIMVANVFFVIIPGQKRMVAAAERGAVPDAEDGIRAKQRSVHNTYFTLPVLFVMTSNHYAMTYSHEYNWAILIAISLAGALIRIYFVARHSGKASPVPLIIAGLLLAGVAAVIAPRASAAAGDTVAFDEVQSVVMQRCTTCHSAQPTHPAFPAAPAGVILDTGEQIAAEAQRIHQQTVLTRVMPIGNLTSITEEERELIDRWYRAMEEQP